MPRYSYTALELATGRERKGSVEGVTSAGATAALKERGLAPLTLRSEAAGKLAHPALASSTPAGAKRARTLTFGRIISPKALAIFTRQLAMLLKAGMPLLRGLEVLARQERNPAFRTALGGIADTIRSGGTLSDGLQKHPRLFDRLYVNMVKAGESGGRLDVVIDRVAHFLEKSVKVRGRIKSAMTYPLIIMVVAAGIVIALMTFVVPKFESIFASTLKGQALPWLTQAVLGASNFIKHHAVLAAGIGVALYAGSVALARTRAGAHAVDRLKLRIPVMGDLLLKAAVARFARTFGTLLGSGVPILQALSITRDTSDNRHIARALDAVRERIKAGGSVAGPLRATGVFPDMVPSMIEVGEETGALPDMLVRIADSYDEEVDNAVTALTSLIEPAMIVVMAFMVGTIVIALFLPIIRIVQSLG